MNIQEAKRVLQEKHTPVPFQHQHDQVTLIGEYEWLFQRVKLKMQIKKFPCDTT